MRDLTPSAWVLAAVAVAARVSRLSEPAGAGTTAAAMSRELAVLSHDIARELKATGRGLR